MTKLTKKEQAIIERLKKHNKLRAKCYPEQEAEFERIIKALEKM